MDLMKKVIETKASSFDEEVAQHVWVDAMVEEYEPIIKNTIWKVVLRLEGKSMVGSRWIYKVNQEENRRIENYKAIFVSKVFS